MSKAADEFGCAGSGALRLSDRILESAIKGQKYAHEVCDPVKDFNDPALLAALREVFQFFLKGAISLHRNGRRPGFWEGDVAQRQLNFLGQVVQLHAVIHISRFVQKERPAIEWKELAKAIPSQGLSEGSITSRSARRFVQIFAQASSADRVLVRALPLVLCDPTDFNACAKALEPLSVLSGDAAGQQIFVGEHPSQRQETPLPVPCLAV